jgi:hypothetical protein
VKRHQNGQETAPERQDVLDVHGVESVLRRKEGKRLKL